MSSSVGTRGFQPDELSRSPGVQRLPVSMWKTPSRSRSATPRTKTISGISAKRNCESPKVADDFVEVCTRFGEAAAAAGAAEGWGADCVGCGVRSDGAGAGLDAGCGLTGATLVQPQITRVSAM